MRLSIRNQLGATIETVTRGEVMGTIRLQLDGGQEITSAITLDAVDDLGLSDGQHVTVLVKSTDVAIASDAVNGLSIRNQVSGTIERVDDGVVMTTVKVAIAGGQSLVAAITKDGAQDLNLAEGDSITALMKSTEVSIAVD
jgi:molybdate transport system regulatory protein